MKWHHLFNLTNIIAFQPQYTTSIYCHFLIIHFTNLTDGLVGDLMVLVEYNALGNYAAMKTIKTKPTKIAIIYDEEPEYLSKLCEGIAQYVHERRNFSLLYRRAHTLKGIDDFSDCDGIIFHADPEMPLACADNRQLIDVLKATGLPIIDAYDFHLRDPAVISIDCNAPRIGSMAAEWFLRRGFTNFAYYGISKFPFSCQLQKAFSATVQKAGFACALRDLDSYERKDIGLRKWLRKLPPRTAMFCLNDGLAWNIVNDCLQIGKKVPNDIAIIGTCNSARCLLSPITITSIDPNFHGVGYAAMRILEKVIEHPFKPKPRPIFNRVPAGEIYERETTAVYPVDPPWLAKALLIIDANLDHAITISELAKLVGVSQSSLRTVFRNVLGVSAGKYILSARMSEAKRLVDEGRLSIKEIASELRFSSQSYFCRAYAAYYGRPPSAGRHPARK